MRLPRLSFQLLQVLMDLSCEYQIEVRSLCIILATFNVCLFRDNFLNESFEKFDDRPWPLFGCSEEQLAAWNEYHVQLQNQGFVECPFFKSLAM